MTTARLSSVERAADLPRTHRARPPCIRILPRTGAGEAMTTARLSSVERAADLLRTHGAGPQAADLPHPGPRRLRGRSPSLPRLGTAATPGGWILVRRARPPFARTQTPCGAGKR